MVERCYVYSRFYSYEKRGKVSVHFAEQVSVCEKVIVIVCSLSLGPSDRVKSGAKV